MTDEAKEKAFEDWKASADFQCITDMQKAIEADKEIEKIDRGTEDITQDWNDVCTRWWKLVDTLKVPKKSKGK